MKLRCSALMLVITAAVAAFEARPSGSIVTAISSVAVTADGSVVAALRYASGDVLLAAGGEPRPIWRVPLEYRPVEIIGVGRTFGVFCISKKTDEPRVWILDPSGKVRDQFDLHVGDGREPITAVGASNGGAQVAVATIRGSVYALDAASRFRERGHVAVMGMEGPIGVVAAGPGVTAVAGNQDGSLFLIDARGQRRVPVKESFVSALAFSLDGRTLYVGNPSELALRRVDVRTGAVSSLPIPRPAAHIAIPSDGSLWIIDTGATLVSHLRPTGQLIGSISLPRASLAR
jgi:hypothetical protein